MSSYSCRNAYGRKTTKLSEHGLANALDIGDFITASAQTAAVLEGWGTPQREILAKIAAEKAAAEKHAAEQAAADKTAQTNLASDEGGNPARIRRLRRRRRSALPRQELRVRRSSRACRSCTVTLPGARTRAADRFGFAFDRRRPSPRRPGAANWKVRQEIEQTNIDRHAA